MALKVYFRSISGLKNFKKKLLYQFYFWSILHLLSHRGAFCAEQFPSPASGHSGEVCAVSCQVFIGSIS